MNLDTFNYGAGAQLGSYEDYDKDQYNAQGQSLAPNPPANGTPVANDYSNDTRSPLDYKQQARQAQLDTMSAQNTEGKYVFSDGYMVDKTPDDRMSMARNAAMSYMSAYLAHMGDQNAAIGAGAMNAGETYAYHNARKEREKLLPQLEKSGRYNSLDMGKWLDTGDTKDLIANAGKWQNDGHGSIYNTLTGEVKPSPNYQQPGDKLTHVDTGDSITFVNGNGDVVKTIPKGVKPGSNVATGSGGGIGLDEDETNSNIPEMQNGVYGTRDGKGNFKPLGQKEQVHWREVAEAKTGDQSASQIQQNKNLDKLIDADPSQVEGFTGSLDQYAGLDNPVINAQVSEGDREYLAAAKEIEGYMQNQGVGAAKSMGLSGINTLEEAKRAFASMPQLDRSSPTAFKKSVQRIKEYVDNYNNEQKHNLGVSTKSTSTDEMSNEDLLKHYGG